MDHNLIAAPTALSDWWLKDYVHNITVIILVFFFKSVECKKKYYESGFYLKHKATKGANLQQQSSVRRENIK